jgi:hypothetical protein
MAELVHHVPPRAKSGARKVRGPGESEHAFVTPAEHVKERACNTHRALSILARGGQVTVSYLERSRARAFTCCVHTYKLLARL